MDGLLSIKQDAFCKLMKETLMRIQYTIKIAQFRAAMLSLGISPPTDIQADGEIHRFYIEGDKKGSKNGWYVFFDDFISCGVFGSWKTGESRTWCSHSQRITLQEQAVFEQKITTAKHQLKLDREKSQKFAAINAGRIYFKAAVANPKHPYLLRKQIQPFCAKQYRKNIVLPIVDFKGKIWSLQYITPNGDKWFLKDGLISGCFILVQKKSWNVKYLVCEGFATAASLAEFYPEYTVIAACNAGNLKPVAVGLRRYFPQSEIIICSDDDRLASFNTGIVKGREAAMAAQALFTKPEWPKGSPQELSDFNDLACWQRQNRGAIA